MQTQTQTLEELIQDTVNTFLALGQSFSVYDVTTNIRNLVNSGEVVPVGVAVFGAGQYFIIEHSEVKAIFTDLYQDNGFAEPLSRTFTGSFYLYSAAGAVQPVQPTVTAKVSPLSALGTALSNLGNASLLAVKGIQSRNFTAPVGGLDQGTVISRVRQYLDGCDQRGFTPTARQIQSAIKRNGKSTGWSRSELNSIRDAIQAGTV